MWYLLIVFLQLNWGNTVLDKFDTLDDCTTAQQSIAKSMAQSYPGDQTFEIVCRYQAVHDPATVHHTTHRRITWKSST